MTSEEMALGIDFGTSGARGIAIDTDGETVSEVRQMFPSETVSSPALWRQALWAIMGGMDVQVRERTTRIAINGTSATTLLCSAAGQPASQALMYNDDQGRSELSTIEAIAPEGSPTLSATSSLVKALWLYRHAADRVSNRVSGPVSYIAHQADWLANLLHGVPAISDYHNALKLGFDVRLLTYPDWLKPLPVAHLLPNVKEPGEVIGPLLPKLVDRFSFPKSCQVCAGTTDSIAAFIASGASVAGEAVTSLGSTLVLKLLSPVAIDHQTFGIYSHRMGNLWLAGGASNTGGAVLLHFFSPQEIADLSEQIHKQTAQGQTAQGQTAQGQTAQGQIDLSQPSPLNYYPLLAAGERFPINDPDYPPRLTPRPASDTAFMYGLLDGIARIEKDGYQKLSELGAPELAKVYTSGGGAQNQTWQTIRQQRLGVEVVSAAQTEAAYGTALLAMHGLSRFL